jgi:hypothetical protein
VNSAEEGTEPQPPMWDLVMDMPTLPAPGISRAHDYYTSMVKVIPFSLSGALATHGPLTLATPGLFNNPTILSALNESFTPLQSAESSKGKGPPQPPSRPNSPGGSGDRPPGGGGGSNGPGGTGVTPHQEVQVQEFLLVEDSQGPVVPLVPQDCPAPQGSQEPWAAPPPKESPGTTVLSGQQCLNGMVILTQSSIGFMRVTISSI